MDKAQKYTGLKFEKKDFLHDCIQAICLLIRDGLDIIFSHRTFQEYFAAVFVSQMNNVFAQQKFLKSQVNDMTFNEQFVNLLFEISPKTVEQNVLIPKIHELEKMIEYNGKLTIKSYKRLLKAIYHSMKFSSKDVINDNGEERPLLALVVEDRSFFDVTNFIGSKLLRFSFFPSLPINSFIKLFSGNRTTDSHFIEIDTILNDKILFTAFSEGNRWASISYFQQIFDVKKQLVEKHKEQEMFLEEELFE